MAKKVHVVPLREYVPAANGSPHFLARHGSVRELDAFWIKLSQSGSVELRELPIEGSEVQVLASTKGPYCVDAAGAMLEPLAQTQEGRTCPERAVEGPITVKWSHVWESRLSDGVIVLGPAQDAEDDHHG
jgi:hypothetical protein